MAITGMGIVSPCGNEPGEFFQNLVAGKSGIARLPETFAPRLKVRIAAQVDFNPEHHFAPPKQRMLDRVSQFALVAAAQAVADAKPDWSDDERRSAGVFLGTGMGGANAIEDGYVTLYRDNSDRVKPFSVLLAMNNAAAAWLGSEHRLSGPNLTYSTACSSSAVAIGEAWRRIRSGDSNIMLAGGAEAPLTHGTLRAWEALKTLAMEDADDPATSCKPFARDRTGMVLGEGAAVLVLEEWERARRRGAHIHAELAGYGLSTDGEHITHPSVAGQAETMRLALESAGLDPTAIGYVNAHGTGTLANDAVETAAVRAVFGICAHSVAISSTKSMHAHLLGAAGAIELIATVLALKTGTAPPTLNLNIPDPVCDLDYVPNIARSGLRIGAAMSNSFAFGGTNAVLIVRAA
ncbi:MAG: beta-ketoacyl-[acyl-carrier-protein] synthase family protein [Lysobacterales bacterium]